MARAARSLVELEGDVYRHLKENAATSFWTPAHLRMVLNERKDFWEMRLHHKHEGFSTEVYTADIEADEPYYSLEKYVGRLKRVARLYPAQKREVTLTRAERVSGSISTRSVSALAIPTYRLVGRYIKLEPTPGEDVEGGLKIETEVASERLTADEDTLPADWPIFMETLLVLDTAQSLLDDEEAQDAESQFRSGFIRRLQEYKGQFDEWVHSRALSRQFVVRHGQGG